MLPSVDDVVAAVARAVDAELDGLTTQMAEWFTEVIPEFRHDETVRRLMFASTSSNLVAIVDMLAHNIPIEQIAVPPAAAEYARRFAQHDLSLEALLRAYRLGEHRFVAWCIAALARMDLDTPLALAAVAEVGDRTNRYIDQVIEGLIDIYEAEHRRWGSRTGAGRAAQLRMVMDNDQLGQEAAEQVLDTPLSGWHVAAVAWLPADVAGADTGQALQAATRHLVATSGRTPITMLADERTLWAWISAPTSPRVDRAKLAELLAATPDMRVALGAPGTGLGGFRGSLREALRARAVAETAQDQTGRLVAFDDVAVVALLTDQSDDVRRWVGRVLPGLTADDVAARQLRETVRVFLDAGGSYTQAAARLQLHKNTVHYRVRKAEEILGRALAEDRLEIEVALRATDLLARRIL